MTLFSKDSGDRFPAISRLLAHASALAASAVISVSAFAGVEMSDSVQKVERYVDDNGQVQRRFVDAAQVIPGDELRYTITFENGGRDAIDAGSIVITNPLPNNTVYIDGSAFGSGTVIEFSADDGDTFAPATELTVARDGTDVPASATDYTTIRWTFEPSLEAGEKSHVSFDVRLQ